MMRAILLLILLSVLSNLYGQTPVGSSFTTTNENEWLGWDVDINYDGSLVAISSIAFPDDNKPDGVVRLFRRMGNEWEQIGEDIVTETASNGFGYAVSLAESGNRLAIGAPSHDTPFSGCGAVFIYDILADEVVNTAVIEGVASLQGIGFSIDLSYQGNTVIIGSQDTEYATVQVYEEQDDSWQLKGEPITSDVYGDKFGYQVMIDSSGNLIAAIAVATGVLNGELPNIKVFHYTNGDWQMNNDIITSSDADNRVQYFGLSNNGSLIAAKKRKPDFGNITFHTIQNNELEQRTDLISGELDFNLILESNLLSLAKNGQAIAVEGSSKIKILSYDSGLWIDDDLTIGPENAIQNMKLSENGEYLIVSLSAISFAEKEVIVYQLENVVNSAAELKAPELEVYPNPVSEKLFTGASAFDYKIIEVESGRVIETGYTDNGEIHVSELKPGAYLLAVEKGTKTSRLKFIKQ